MSKNREGADIGVQRDTVTAFLTVSGRDFDLEECTRFIGLFPTRTWQQAHAHLTKRIDLPNTEWSIGIEKGEFDSLSDAVNAVIGMVWEKRSRVRDYAERHGLEISFICNVTIWNDAPEYSLSADDIQRLGSLGANFGLDIFDYRSQEDDGI